jgi:hypothetical protein
LLRIEMLKQISDLYSVTKRIGFKWLRIGSVLGYCEYSE